MHSMSCCAGGTEHSTLLSCLFHVIVVLPFRYKERYYVPLVLCFLAAECRRWLSRKLSMATSRSFMADEVRVAGEDWLTICARWFGPQEFRESPIGVLQLGEDRDAAALVAGFVSIMQGLGCNDKVWMSSSTISCTFDGAKVLLSAVSRSLRERVLPKDEEEEEQKESAQEERPLAGMYTLYCCSHRTQRVDADATKNSPIVRKLHSLLKNTANFFGRSTKRWHGMRRVARCMGYATELGAKKAVLCRYTKLQKTRFVVWKAKAIKRWLKNIFALLPYLEGSKFKDRKTRRKASGLLRRAQKAQYVYALHHYFHYCAALQHLSLSTQGYQAVLPTLRHSLVTCHHMLDAARTNTFRQKWDPSTGKYHTVKLMGTLEELDHVDNWYTRLLGYTRQALKDRFPEDEIVTAASLFDRRTWPKEPKDLSKDDRLPALQKLSSTFPAIKQFSEKQFVSAACAVAAMVPPLVSSRGRIRAHDCTHCWAIASQASWATSHLPVVRAATVLCTIAQSQSSTERMNSMLKLAAGGRRWRLTGQGLADEVLIRTVGPSLPDAEDLIHRAVVQWSIAAERRPQSYEDSSESDSDEMGTSDSDTSFATGSSISSGEEGSMSSRSAASADDDEEPLPQPEPAEPQQPEQAEEDVQQDAPQDAAPDFLSWLSKYRPQLAAYEIRLRRDGWDTVQSLKLLTVEDMAQLNILPGHRRLLVDTVKDL